MRTLATLLAILAACSARPARYLVLPAAPDYLLQSPDGQKRAFPDTTSSFSNPFDGWVDLSQGMTLKLERAYFQPPQSRRLQHYIGLETAQYRYQSAGALRQIHYSPLPGRPAGQPPVTTAIPETQLSARHHRFLFQVVLGRETGSARAVLLSGDSQSAIATFSERLIRMGSCTGADQAALHCSAIPEDATASLSFEIVANGKPLAVLWGTTLAGVVGPRRPVKLSRSFRDRMAPVQFDAADPNALRLPLLPGDNLTF